MAVATIVGSLLPIMWSTKTGAEVMQPLATPVIFAWLREGELKRDQLKRRS